MSVLFRQTNNILLSVVFGLDIRSLGMGFELVCKEWSQHVTRHQVWKLICTRLLRPHPLTTVDRPAAEWKALYRILPSDICSMVYVPAGIFYHLSKCKDNIVSQRSHLPAFWIDDVPVITVVYENYCQGILHKCREKLHLKPKEKYLYHPQTCVSWEEADKFAECHRKQLPTRAQWEKAARGETTRLWPWGNTWDSSKCNSLASKFDSTTPVGKYPKGRSPYGCYDMAGNVFEWLKDADEPDNFKFNHGASYNRGRTDQTTMYVESDPLSKKMTDVGFRCVFSIPERLTHLSYQTTTSKTSTENVVVRHSLAWEY